MSSPLGTGVNTPQTFPVLTEMWAILEGSLQAQARKLVNDIATAEKKDPKVLWQLVREQIRIGLTDVDLDLEDQEKFPTYCPFPTHHQDGAVITKCRAPCLLGFSSCSKHCHTPLSSSSQRNESSTLELVDRVFDYKGYTYFVDSKSIARDKNGVPKGIVKEDVLYLFSKLTNA